jgi:hypothetical protein
MTSWLDPKQIQALRFRALGDIRAACQQEPTNAEGFSNL